MKNIQETVKVCPYLHYASTAAAANCLVRRMIHSAHGEGAKRGTLHRFAAQSSLHGERPTDSNSSATIESLIPCRSVTMDGPTTRYSFNRSCIALLQVHTPSHQLLWQACLITQLAVRRSCSAHAQLSYAAVRPSGRQVAQTAVVHAPLTRWVHTDAAGPWQMCMCMLLWLSQALPMLELLSGFISCPVTSRCDGDACSGASGAP